MISPALASTEPRRLDEAVARVSEGAPRWARASPAEREALARSMLAGLDRLAPRLAREACEAKGLPFGSPMSGDEWLAGVYIALRYLRQIAGSLSVLGRTGNTPVGRTTETIDGRLAERVFPTDALDRILWFGFSGEVHYLEGVGARDAREQRARFHKEPDHAGRVCLVLGAGNVNSIPVLDVGTKLFNEGKACILKMNPINAYAGAVFEEAFQEAIARGVLAIVYGGREEGGYLVQHPGVDEVHLTGSNATHDAIVWGPPGPEREQRIARNEPLLRKEMTSELGDVSPVLVAPGPWRDRDLELFAESVAGMVTQNGAFNCAAARLIVLPRGWKHRDRFLGLVERFLAAAPPRPEWYPGARERLASLARGRSQVKEIAGAEGTLPWTLVPGIDPDSDDPFFTTEAFCPALAETSVGSEDPVQFLDAAVAFVNERLWATLLAQVLVPPRALADPEIRRAVHRAVRRLEYGTVGVNCFGAYGFAFSTSPWGGFPGQPLGNVRSGRGFVHNTRMLEKVEKFVLWAPDTAISKPVHFPTHRTLHLLGRRLCALEGHRDWRVLPGVLWAGLRG